MHPKSGEVKYLRHPILKYLLIVLFISYYAGGVAFTHVHHYTTYTIIHSHPYLPGADGQPHHDHSTDALNTIETLEHVMMDVVPCLVVGAVWILLSVFSFEHTLSTFTRILRGCKLRAPPAY